MKQILFFIFSLLTLVNLPVHAVVKLYEVEESSAHRQLRHVDPVDYETIKQEAGSLVERAQKIEQIFLEDPAIDGIQLIGSSDSLVSDDMWPVVRGMIARARDPNYTQITTLDLSGNDITNNGFSYLFTGLVTRGILDDWGTVEGQSNRLHPLTINLQENSIKVDELVRSCSATALKKGVTFKFQAD